MFPKVNGWVTLVAEGDELKPNKKLIEANHGTLLQFANVGDHGLYFSIYNNSNKFCHYECMWSENIKVNDIELDLDNLVTIIQGLNIDKNRFEKILHPRNFNDILGAFRDGPVLTTFVL